jgi:hypothetical protein
MASTFTIVVTFIVLFGTFMGLYGVATGTVNLTNTLNQITGPFPTLVTNQCNSNDLSCNVSNIGSGLIWFFSSLGSILFRIGAFFYLIYQFASILGVLTSIPVLGPAFTAIFLIVLAAWAFSRIPGGGGRSDT